MFLMGNSYDSLQASRKGYDDLAVQMAERDRQARADAWKQSQDAAIFAQRQAEEDGRQRRAQDYQFSQAATNEQDRRDQMANRRFEFGVTSKQHDTSEARIAKSEADRIQMQKDTNATNLKLGNEDADYREAVNRIDKGMIAHPSDIDTLFPNMNAEQKARAASYWKEQNDRAHEDYQSITGYAKAANGITKDLRSKAKKDGTPMTEDEAYGLLGAQRSTAKWLPTLRFDEATQQWTPQMPKPYTAPTATSTNGADAPTGFQIPFTARSARMPFPGSTSEPPAMTPETPAAPMPTPAPDGGWLRSAARTAGNLVVPNAGNLLFGRAPAPVAPTPLPPVAAPVMPLPPAQTNGFAFSRMPMPAPTPPNGVFADRPEMTKPPVMPVPVTNAPAYAPRTMPFGSNGSTVTDFSQRPDAPAVPAPVMPPTNAAPVADRDGMVRVKSPDGRTGRIPAAKFQAARAAGWVAVSDMPIQ